jgi:chloramphenicol 3-O-phosphotransferase
VTILLLSGPPASGKNTIAELVAKRVARCAAIDVDQLRDMVIQPANTTWESRERAQREELAVRNACSIARNLMDSGYDVVISDVITETALETYKSALSGTAIKTIVLLPTENEIMGRLLSRPDYLSRGEVQSQYDQQSRFTEYDEKLDNTEMAPDAVVEWLLERWEARTLAANG